jgi:hypothetical protein
MEFRDRFEEEQNRCFERMKIADALEASRSATRRWLSGIGQG